MSSATERDRWALILDELNKSIPRQQYETWFRSVALRSLSDQRIELDVPSRFARDWLQAYYLQVIQDAAQRVLSQRPEVAMSVRMAGATAPGSLPAEVASPAMAPSSRPGPDAGAPVPGLNLRYTFNTFVVGENNRLAHAAALQVSKAPGKSYNPLFIHGDVGLGKTHLMQAVAHAIKSAQPSARVCYLSCEAFVNDYISAVAGGTLEAFRHRYRQMDVLLIDDVHFLANKEASQEEFHHTFNALYNAQKQLVLSSDSPPSEISAITEQLRSRFKWGLDVPIDKPSFETRCAIIRRKAEERGCPIPEEVSLYVGTLFDTNIRELEGAVTKLASLSALRGRPVDLTLAQEAFRGAVRTESARVRVEEIQSAVTERYGVRTADLQSRSRIRTFAFPRQVCMYLARKLTDHSFEEIGAFFGGRDHTTVLYACQQIEEKRARDPELDLLLEQVTQKLKHS